jgi:transcriptional regulator with XRE-family HTH domain
MSNFSERLKELRLNKNLTQEQLAALTELGYPTIKSYECGYRKPGHDALIAIADYFDVSLDYLVGRED